MKHLGYIFLFLLSLTLFCFSFFSDFQLSFLVSFFPFFLSFPFPSLLDHSFFPSSPVNPSMLLGLIPSAENLLLF